MTTRLASLRDYFHTSAEEYEPLLTLSLPNGEGVLDQPQTRSANQASGGPKSRNIIEDFAHFVKADLASEEKAKPSLISRFKNMIEGKKEWYEREKERWKLEPSDSQKRAASNILQHSSSFGSSMDELSGEKTNGSASNSKEDADFNSEMSSFDPKITVRRSNTVIEVVGRSESEAGIIYPKSARRRLKMDNVRKTRSLDFEGVEEEDEVGDSFQPWLHGFSPEGKIN